MRARFNSRPFTAYQLPRIDSLTPASMLTGEPILTNDYAPPVSRLDESSSAIAADHDHLMSRIVQGPHEGTSTGGGWDRGTDVAKKVRADDDDDDEEGETTKKGAAGANTSCASNVDEHHPPAKDSSAPKKRWHRVSEVSPDDGTELGGASDDGEEEEEDDDDENDDDLDDPVEDLGPDEPEPEIESSEGRSSEKESPYQQQVAARGDRDIDPATTAGDAEDSAFVDDDASMIDEDESEMNEKAESVVSVSSSRSFKKTPDGEEEEEEEEISSCAAATSTSASASAAAAGGSLGMPPSSSSNKARTKIHIKIPLRRTVTEHQAYDRASSEDVLLDGGGKDIRQGQEGKHGFGVVVTEKELEEQTKRANLALVEKSSDGRAAQESKVEEPTEKNQRATPLAAKTTTRINAIEQHPLTTDPVHINAIRDSNGPTSQDVGQTLSHTVGMGSASLSSMSGSPSFAPEAAQAATLAAIHAVQDAWGKRSVHLNLSSEGGYNASSGLDPNQVDPSLLLSIKLGVPAVATSPSDPNGGGREGPIRPANVDFNSLALALPHNLRVVSPIEMDVGGLMVEQEQAREGGGPTYDGGEGPSGAAAAKMSTVVVIASLTVSRPKISPESAAARNGGIGKHAAEKARVQRMQSTIDALLRRNGELVHEQAMIRKESDELKVRLLRASGVAAAAFAPTSSLGALPPNYAALFPPVPCIDPSGGAAAAAAAAARIRAAGIRGVQVVGESPDKSDGANKLSAERHTPSPSSAPGAVLPPASAQLPATARTTQVAGPENNSSVFSLLLQTPEERQRMLRELETAEAQLRSLEFQSKSPGADKDEGETSNKKRKLDVQVTGAAAQINPSPLATPPPLASVQKDEMDGVEALARLSEAFVLASSSKAEGTEVGTARGTLSPEMVSSPSANSSDKPPDKSEWRDKPRKLKEGTTQKGKVRTFVQHVYRDHSMSKPTTLDMVGATAVVTNKTASTLDRASEKVKEHRGPKLLPLCQKKKQEELHLLVNGKSRPRVNRGQPCFPLKLHNLLSEVEADGDSSIIGWQSHGRCFVVRKQEEFIKQIMPRFFSLTKYCSFLRQLNLYGFQRISHGPDKGAYYHELFLRGMPWLSTTMVRIRVNGKMVRSANNPDLEPNFYTMPALSSNPDEHVSEREMDLIRQRIEQRRHGDKRDNLRKLASGQKS